jgi:type II secretory pathway pseudopilin PulG
MDALTVALISGLVAAVVGSIIGAAAAVLFQRWSEARRKLETRRFRVYMGMLDVYQRHFWKLVA